MTRYVVYREENASRLRTLAGTFETAESAQALADYCNGLHFATSTYVVCSTSEATSRHIKI